MIFTPHQEPETGPGSAWGSPQVPSRGRVGRRSRAWPRGRRATFVVRPRPRVEGRAWGVGRRVKVPCADPRRRYTPSVERDARELGRHMTIRDVAHHLGVSRDVIQDLPKRDLARRFAEPQPKHLRHLAIAEIAVATGHRSLTLVRDRESGAVVFVGDGQGAKALKPFRKRLRSSAAVIEAVAGERSAADRAAASTRLPQAKIICDRFPVRKPVDEKPTAVRRAPHREATDVMRKKALKGARWLVLKAAEDLDEEEDETTMLVHFGEGKSQQFTLERVMNSTRTAGRPSGASGG
ncbi:MAG: transposase [Frankiaceae bacterium]